MVSVPADDRQRGMPRATRDAPRSPDEVLHADKTERADVVLAVRRSPRVDAHLHNENTMPQLEDAAFHEEEATDEAIDTASSTASCSSDDEAYHKSTKKYQSLKKSTNLTSKTTKEATFESIAKKDHHEKFLKDALEILLKDAVFGASSRDAKVLEWTNPEDMQRMFDFGLKKTGATHEELLKLMKSTIQHSVKTAHPYFVNQLFSSLDPYGLVGQWLTDALNPSVYTYEVSPVFSLMEEVVLQEMRAIVGFPNGDGDGIFCPGGSMANGYAISCARYKFMPDIKVSKTI